MSKYLACTNLKVAGLPVEEIAVHAGTIPYELLCGVHKRLQFIEHGED